MTFDSTEHAMFSLTLTTDHEIEQAIPQVTYETKSLMALSNLIIVIMFILMTYKSPLQWL